MTVKMVASDRAQSGERLWPPFAGPEGLAAVESVPLEERGLPRSTHELVKRAASMWPQHPAVSVLVDAERWRSPYTLTFAELADAVDRAARVLNDAGVTRGQAVAVLSLNCAELLPLLLAAQAAGIYAPVNPALSTEHARYLVRLMGAGLMVAAGPELDRETWERARTIASEVGAHTLLALRPTGATGSPPPLEPLAETEVGYLAERAARFAGGSPGLPPAPGLSPAPEPSPARERTPAPELWPGPDDIASYLHTGGTTGLPKIAARTHANEVSNAWMIAGADIMEPGSAVFAALPLFHTNALLVTVLAPLFKGQHVVWGGPLGYRDPALFGVFWKLIEHYRIASMSAVPTVYQVLSQVPVDADISSLRLPIVGAAPLPPAVRAAFEERTGVALCEGYGLTEGTCASSRSWPDDPRPGTVGQRLPYQQARAVRIDEQTGAWTFLADGETGNLVLRGPNTFAGYLAASADGPQLWSDERVQDGWLNTGDIGSVDADGYIRLAGRAKDLIIRGGHNIDPRTIEDALLEHPAVVSAAAVGQPDARAGEVPVAFVSVAPGSRITGDALREWARDRVPEPAAAPKAVRIVDQIPVTGIGKQFKPELRRRAAETAARDALGGLEIQDQAHAVLVDGAVEIQVPHSAADEQVAAALGAFAWSWTFV